MTEALLIAVLIVGIANLALVILLIGGRRDAARDIDRLKRDMLDEQRALRAEVSENTRRSINAVGETLLNEYQRDTLNQEQRFKTFALENAQRMEQIRRSVERQLADIREDNGKKLDEMRSIVDEKLQKTLEDKLSRSFALVSERLEQVYKGLGEMQTLASGVGDLSKVLSNVKTRGILGEIQLGAILGEMMAPEQYEVNAKVKQATNERVEFAIKLPADDGTVLLPNDRYPLDREVFRLYYTSECEDQQTIDIYFEDNSEPAQLYQLAFDFNNETEDEDSVVTADSKELPVTIVGH